MTSVDVAANLKKVLEDVSASTPKDGDATLIAVSKTYDADHIEPALQVGHRVFGENRVQESQQKWPALRSKYPDLELHLIGPLQSNKAADAVALFDVIHTVDREKIAKTLAVEMSKQEKHLGVFIQVNTGAEPQKAGVLPEEADAFIERCKDHYGLSVIGLMCIPPVNEDPESHFLLLHNLAAKHDLSNLSMGMSADYPVALKCGATHVRVGSAIFGARDYS